ncbi:MAG: glycosyltransferase family 4 protein [Candidatus Bathyarchaeota archaeon]|nr:MAG: glycosyltransferase family 4 protein [Candidatus Bathyarchaeota archaeon]
MDICFATWEFPPRIVGGIARHCNGLAKALTRNGHEVYVVTLDFPGTPSYEESDGVMIYRAATELGHPNFLTWALLFNHFIEKKIADVNRKVDFDVIHVHDWLTGFAGISFKHQMQKPMVATIHGTEVGRAQGLHNPDSFTIDGIEWWTTYEADKVIVTSDSMKGEVHGHFHLPQEKIEIIPNGIDPKRYNASVNRSAVRGRYGVNPREKLILCVGRLVPQKGIEYLISAVPRISERYREARLLIVGEGWLRGHLERIARSTGYQRKITFTGWIPDHELIALLNSADVLVVPSIYEPFGIVALEGMAAGVPVVVSDIGGLSEIVDHERTGILAYSRSPESIAWAIERVLSDPDHSEWLVTNARDMIQKTYSWEAIAMRTAKVYKEVAG